MKGNLHCFLMVLFILSACTQPEVESQAVTPSPTSITIHSPMRPDFSGEGGEEYSEVQIQLIQNDTYINQEAMLVDWWVNYWGLAENRPFHPETKDLHYKYLFDEENNAFVFLEASGEGYLGKIFALPIKNGQFMKVPPTIPEGEFNIPEGFGPLEISGGEYILAFSEGNLVRIDSSGKIVERLNMESAQWVREIVINSESQSPEKFSSVTLEDFTSGKLQEIESNWLEKNNPFSGREIFSDSITITRHSWGFEKLTINCNNRVLMEAYLADRSTFPAKIISYYNMQLPKDFFPDPEKEIMDFYNNLGYFLVSQTWLNPNGSYTTLHYLSWNNPFDSLPNNKSNEVPVPLYRIENLKMVGDSIDMTILYYLNEKKFMNYSDSPKPYLDEWLNTGNLPKELENFIFPPYVVQYLD